MEHLNPRHGARVVALEKPTETERGRMVFPALYPKPAHLGRNGVFDRSWSTAPHQRVMGFCGAARIFTVYAPNPRIRTYAACPAAFICLSFGFP